MAGVCGDRSVFVTSHRPAHSSRAHVFSLARILHFRIEVFFLFAHLPPRCTSSSLDLELAKILDAHNQGIATWVLTGVLCELHTPPPLIPRDQWTASTATLACLETVSK